MTVERLLSKVELSELLGISIRTIDRLRVRGDLAAVRVRGRVLFSPADVTAFINGQRRGSPHLVGRAAAM